MSNVKSLRDKIFLISFFNTNWSRIRNTVHVNKDIIKYVEGSCK